MVGDPDGEVNRVALALDPTLETVRQAVEMGAQVLLTHHPLIFRPLKNLNLSDPTAAAAALALKHHLAVVSAHTNLDAAENGVSSALAECLELQNIDVLDPIVEESHYKLTVFVPLGNEDALRRALFATGVCQGDSFTSITERANLVESHGRLERDDRVRLEVVVNKSGLAAAVAAAASVDPGQSPVYDVVPLVPQKGRVGYGCIGSLEKALKIEQLIDRVKENLPRSVLRVAAPPSGTVSRIAVMGGSGGSAMDKARRQGADVFITGDLGYHQAREAEEKGICLIDAGHFATEWPIIPKLAARLERLAGERGLHLNVLIIKNEKDPWINTEV